MKKLIAAALAVFLCFSLTAVSFASGEASGGPSGGSSAVYAYTISADGLEADAEAEFTLDGEMTAAGVSGFSFAGKNAGLLSVLGDDTTEGAVSAKLGGSDANYDVSDPAISIWPAAQEKLGFTSFDSVMDASAGPQATARGGAYLELDGIYATGTTGIVTAGSDSDRYSGSSDDDYIDTVVVLRDSYLESDTGSDIASVNWPHATSLMVRGSNRTALSVGESETYYYGTGVVVDGWAAMATDSAVGMGLDMVAYNSYAATRLGGYCSYSDSRCRDFLYGTTYESAEYGAIIANFGELYILNTDDAAVDTNVIRSSSGAADLPVRAAVDPLAFAQESDIVSGVSSSVAGFRNAVMMHVPDLMGGGGKISDAPGILYVKGSTIGTYEELAPEDYTSGGYKASWLEKSTEANYAYLEYTMGAAILIRSDNAFIHLEDAQVDSWTGVLIQSALNADANGNWIGADEEIKDTIGIDVLVDGTTALTGDIRHEDYHRAMTVTLADSASLTGDIITGTADTWHAKFADYLDSGANFIRDLDGYDTVWGCSVTIGEGTVWTVADSSNITALTVEPGAVLNGSVTVDGQAVDVSAGGTWEGDIVITAAASASDGGSGEATSELASSVHLEGVDVMGAFTLDVDVTFEDQGSGVKAYALDFDGHHIEGVINMGVWTASSEDSAEQDISSSVQAAYEALTGAGGN